MKNLIIKSTKIHDGFERKNLGKIWDKNKFEQGAVTIQSKIVRKGKNAIRIIIHKGDKTEKRKGSKISERDELLERKDIWSVEEKAYHYSFSIYLPENFPIVPTRLVLAQWKQDSNFSNVLVDNPVLAIRYQEGVFKITLQISKERTILFSTDKKMRGVWIDLVFNVKFSRKAGFVQVLMNKKEIVNYKGVTAYSERWGYKEPERFYFKMGLYRDRMQEPMTAYFDEFTKYEFKLK